MPVLQGSILDWGGSGFSDVKILGFIPEVNFSFVLPLICLSVVSLYGYSTLKSDYKMPTLQEVEAYTKENKHLPEVPSAQEIKENGLKLIIKSFFIEISKGIILEKELSDLESIRIEAAILQEDNYSQDLQNLICNSKLSGKSS